MSPHHEEPVRSSPADASHAGLGALAGLILALSVTLPAMGLEAQASELWSRAVAATPNPVHGERLYGKLCVGCHRAHGSGAGNRQYPQLSGQQEQYLLEQLVLFISLDGRAPKMHRVLVRSSLTDPQSLRDLSAYLAAQPHDPHGEHGDGHRLGVARKIYRESCSGCHGALGHGRAQGPIPSIGGQNYTYLLIQIKGFAAGHRSNADPAVTEAMSRLRSDEMSAVADFISRMPDSADLGYGVLRTASTSR